MAGTCFNTAMWREGKTNKLFFYCIKTCLPGWLGDKWASTAVLKPVQGQFLTSVQSMLIIIEINKLEWQVTTADIARIQGIIFNS